MIPGVRSPALRGTETADSFRTGLRFARSAAAERARILRMKALGTPDPQVERPRRPVFIIGSPRSGTTLLFHLLRSHEEIRSLQGEGHVLWNAYQHPRFKLWSSDRATVEDVREPERRFVYASIARITRGFTFLDKTPKNSLKVPYLARLFPDARFLFLKRDGRAAVSSLIEGWKERRGISYRLPVKLRLADYRGRLWSYVLPAGWRQLIGTSIAEVAARQYVASCETALDDLRALPQERVLEVAYEDLVVRPVEVSRQLQEALELPNSSSVSDFARHLADHRAGSITAPRIDKWQDRGDEVAGILPSITSTMQRLGYDAQP